MNTPRPSDWHRLVPYLSGEYGPEEEAELQGWIVEDEARARLMDELKQVWDVTEEAPAPRDTEAAWQEVSAKLETGDLAAAGDVEQPREDAACKVEAGSKRLLRSEGNDLPRRCSRAAWRRRPRSYGVAVVGAALAAVALLAVLLLQGGLFGSSSGQPARVFTTKKGQRATVRLSDGTQVRLNVDSRLSLPAAFSDGIREVRIEGEAYFEVARDADRPFLVRTKGAVIRVLGTAFDVRAYAGDDDAVHVAVAEGEVTLAPEPSEPESEGNPSVSEGKPSPEELSSQGEAVRRDTVLLRAHHLGIVSGRHVQAVRQGVRLAQQLAWTKGQLVLDDVPFGEVVRKLERWYDLHVEAPGVVPAEVDRLNATFDDAPLEEVLKAVAAALDLEYEREGQTVFFHPGEQAPARSA